MVEAKFPPLGFGPAAKPALAAPSTFMSCPLDAVLRVSLALLQRAAEV
jgi:hypothetical protein